MNPSGIIEIEIKGYDKYKCRKDIVNPQWFKASNQIFEDDDLFDFTLEEMAVWWYILAACSKQKSKVVRISVKKAAARIPPELLHKTVEKLINAGICSVPVRVAPGSRTEPVQVTDAIRALEGSGEEEERRGGESANAPPPAQEPSAVEEEIGPVRGLQGNSLLDQVLPDVAKSIQKSWLELYDHAWLKVCLVRAIEHHMDKHSALSPRDVEGWQKKFCAWLKTERAPKLKPKPAPAKVHKPKEPWPTGAKDRALGKVSAVDAMVAAKVGVS